MARSNNNDNGNQGGIGGRGNRLCPDDDGCRHVAAQDPFAAILELTPEQRARCTRRHRDLMDPDETAAAWAVAIPAQELLAIQERVDELTGANRNLINCTLTVEQLRVQHRRESAVCGQLVTQHQEEQTARLLNDQAVAVANLIMNAQHPDEVFAAFIRTLEARVFSMMQTALPICHEECGRGNQPNDDVDNEGA